MEIKTRSQWKGLQPGLVKVTWQVRELNETKALGEMQLRARVFLSLFFDCTPSDAASVCGSLHQLFSFCSSSPFCSTVLLPL